MSIVGGVDIHRKQLTFDYVDEQTQRWERGRIAPADREHVADWLTRFDPPASGLVAFAMEGCTGWRYVAERCPRRVSERIWPSRPTRRRCGARNGGPRPTRRTRGCCGSCWPREGCRSTTSRSRRCCSGGRCSSFTRICGCNTCRGTGKRAQARTDERPYLAVHLCPYTDSWRRRRRGGSQGAGAANHGDVPTPCYFAPPPGHYWQ
jgi:hypothetical protein